MGQKTSSLGKRRPAIISKLPEKPVPIYRLDFPDKKQLSRYYTNTDMAASVTREFHNLVMVKIDRPPVLDLTHITYTPAEAAVFDGELSSTMCLSVVQPVTLDGIFDEFVLFRIHLHTTEAFHHTKRRIETLLTSHLDLHIKSEVGYVKKKTIEFDDPEYIRLAISALIHMLHRRK